MVSEVRPRTWLGDRMGTLMYGAALLMDYALPLGLIRMYWLLPERRGRWFGGASTSHATYAAIKAAHGRGWQLIAESWERPPRPPMPG